MTEILHIIEPRKRWSARGVQPQNIPRTICVPSWARERVDATQQIRIPDSEIQQTAEICAGMAPYDENFCVVNVAVLLWALAEERDRLRQRLGDTRLLLDVERAHSAPHTRYQRVLDFFGVVFGRRRFLFGPSV